MRAMVPCCPPGRGCNCSQRDEPCILELCRRAPDEELAANAVRRWEVLQATPGHNRRERRFRARVYERARDRALVVLLMREQRLTAAGGRWRAARTRPGELPRPQPITRLDVMVAHHRRRPMR